MTKRLVTGIFGISGCAGCLLTFFYEDVFMELTKFLDIRAYPLVKENKYKGKFDVIFLEGTITFKEDITVVKNLRARTKILVALGTCSALGGVPSIKNFLEKEQVMHFVYPRINHLRSVDPTPVSAYVAVDYFLPECPPNKKEIVNLVKALAIGNKFEYYEDPVCKECRSKENLCLLEKNKPCLGPITRGGCSAICPSNGVECYGCRGPTSDANIKSEIEMLKEKGYDLKSISKRMITFAGLQFKEKVKEISSWLEQ